MALSLPVGLVRPCSLLKRSRGVVPLGSDGIISLVICWPDGGVEASGFPSIPLFSVSAVLLSFLAHTSRLDFLPFWAAGWLKRPIPLDIGVGSALQDLVEEKLRGQTLNTS